MHQVSPSIKTKVPKVIAISIIQVIKVYFKKVLSSKKNIS
jgi:hypothetical protein